MNVLQLVAGRQLDELIAVKVFSWRYDEAWGCLVPRNHPAPPLWIPKPEDPDNYRVMNTMKDPSYPYSVHYGGDRPSVKDYSTEIEDAWEIFTCLRNQDAHWCPSIFWDDDDGLSDGYWNVSIYYYGENEDEFKSFGAYADTAPLAICRAALFPSPLGELEY